MSHTPGPFYMTELAYGNYLVITESGLHLAVIHGTQYLPDGIRCDLPAKDNARLFAAATDLLAACKAVSDALANGDLVWKHKRQADSDPYHPANVKLCAAIAKAEAE